MKLRLFCGCFVILALVFGTSVAAGPQEKPTLLQAGGAAATYHGALVTPPLPKPRFVLTDTAGAPFDFRSETQGYVTLLFFGYTHCSDECPLHMAIIAETLRQMPANIANQVKAVFVTTDPARDRAPVLRAWLDQFDRRFIGLTGSEADIAAAQSAAHVPAASKTVLANKDYPVAHASFVLAYTKDDLAHVIYPSGVSLMDWAHDLPLLVDEAWVTR
jgi:protein SCO1/2